MGFSATELVKRTMNRTSRESGWEKVTKRKVASAGGYIPTPTSYTGATTNNTF